MMLEFILFMFACGSHSLAQEGEIIVPDDNKTVCVNDMVEWCKNMQYPQQGVGLAVLSLTYEDPDAYYRVFCSSDSDGTNCTRNKEPWFSCSSSSDRTLTYKGRILTANSTEGSDDDICRTADKAFNELFVQNLSYDNTTLKTEVQKGMEAFFEQMAAMEEQISLIHRMLSRLPSLPEDLWREFNDSFPPRGTGSSPDSTTTVLPGPSSSYNVENTTELQSNRIGKE